MDLKKAIQTRFQKETKGIVNDLELLNELRKCAQRKLEIWEEDIRGCGLTWRGDSLGLEYQELEDRVWEIKNELFGDSAIEV